MKYWEYVKRPDLLNWLEASTQKKENMKDVMFDLETFSTDTNATVVQIGAVYFDRNDPGKLGLQFSMNVDGRTSRGSLNADTFYWWLKQSDEARASILNAEKSELEAFTAFNDFLNVPYVSIWSHATFDFPILMATLKRLGLQPNFSHRQARDIRTLVDLSKIKIADYAREGVHHNALADSVFQAKYCVAGMMKLR